MRVFSEFLCFFPGIISRQTADVLSPSSEQSEISGLSDMETELLVSAIYSFITAISRTRGLNADEFAKEMHRLKYDCLLLFVFLNL